MDTFSSFGTYIKEAKGDRMPFPSRHSFSNANPNCLSLLNPSVEKILRILGGNDDSKRCTVPIPNCIADTVSLSMCLVYSCPILLYSCHTVV